MTKYYRENYPRPQFVRDSFLDLNGSWNFRFDDEDRGKKAGWMAGFEDQKILVPFSYESKRSGIGQETVHPIVWYSRDVDFFPLIQDGGRVLLHVEGADYQLELWVNGVPLGSHQGGYTRGSFDITEGLDARGRGTVVFRISDSLSTVQPRGKQRWLPQNYDCWYVQTTGIWKSVWAEGVSPVRLEHLHLIPHYDTSQLELEYDICGWDETRQVEVETIITFGETRISSHKDQVQKRHYSRTVSLIQDQMKWKVKYWCPKSPNLYDVCIRVYENGQLTDQVGSYFGLRKVSTDSGRVKLNNMDFYLRMVLDQGYWPDTGLTPPDEEALKRDIDKILEYGYNGVRKHQKIEDERFYYWADVKGLVVWCEAPSHYELTEEAMEHVTREWTETVRQYYNHPSVITWVPFNESWGIPRIIEDRMAQQFTEAVCCLTRALDATRPVISNDGWEHTVSDLVTLHDYAEDGEALWNNWRCPEENLENKRAFNGERYAFAKGYHYQGQPILLSEFGGIAYGKEPDAWGYGHAETDEEAFLNRLQSLMDAISRMDWLCGFCYTQLTDVQQEQNGHMDISRKDKIDPEKIRNIVTMKTRRNRQ